MISSRKIVLLVAVGGAVIAGLITLRPRESVRPAALFEVAQTNLVLRDGRWWQVTNAFTGLMLDFYPDGSPRSRSVVSHGLLHGLSEGWHTNGVLQVRELFRKGVSHGLRTKWHLNGVKLSEAPIVLGQIHGRFQRWNEDGVLMEVIEMKHGNPDGISRSYFPSGELKAEALLREGELVEQKYWRDGEWKVVSVSRGQ